MSKYQKQPRWWQYFLAYTVLRPLLLIVGCILFMLSEMVFQTIGGGIARIFKQEPHRWFTCDDVYNISRLPDWLVDFIIIYLDVTGYLEHQLSERIMLELGMSELRRQEAYSRETEEHSLNSDLYEYRLRSYPGISSRFKKLVTSFSSRVAAKTA